MATFDTPSMTNEFTAEARFRVHMPGEENKREFVQRRLTAGIMAHVRRVEKLYREDNAEELARALRRAQEEAQREEREVPDEIGIPGQDMSYYLMADRSLLNHFMREIYEGVHDGIDWYEQDGLTVLTLLSHFFMRWFGTAKKSSNDTKQSLPTSDTGLSPTSAEPSSEAVSTSGSTKKPHGKSRKAPRTTTTS